MARRAVVVAFAAAVVAVLAAVLLALPRPAALARKVIHLAYVPFVAAIPSASDPRTVYLMVADNGGPQCGAGQWRVMRVEEDTAGVHALLSGITIDDGSSHTCTGVHYRKVAVHLRAPLAHRAVYDGRVSRPIYDPRQVPRAGYLPPGYRLRLDLSEHVEQLAGTRIYHRSNGGEIDVTLAVAGTAWSRSIPRKGTVDVAGHAGLFRLVPERCLDWSTAPGLLNSVCANGRPLPEGVILAIARNLVA